MQVIIINNILYNYNNKFRPEEFFIIGSNQMLLNYITGVLPDLEVYHVNQMVMEDFFIWLLERSFMSGIIADIKKQESCWLWFTSSL